MMFFPLTLEAPMKTSARNHFSGTVKNIVKAVD
jgi:hypothetical protein